MAKILLTWELGSGFGHVASLSSIAAELAARGNTVVAALRDPQRGNHFFAPLGVPLIQAPLPPAEPRGSTQPVATYAELLASVGFDSPETLSSMLAGWDRIYDEVSPDAVIFDHSPFAILAAVGRDFGAIQHGTGFYIPPDTKPLPLLRPWLVQDPRDALNREDHVLHGVNSLLRTRGQKSFERLAELYTSTDVRWLATYQDLDHFGPRQGERFHGITPPPTGGLQPSWPGGSGPRVFAYLQPDSTSLTAIETLGKLGYPTIARVAGIESSSIPTDRKSLTVVSDAVDIGRTAQECDLAILSGGHGTLAAVLLAGKPVVVLPIQLEQLLLGKICEREGFGVCVPPGNVRLLTSAVSALGADPGYRIRATEFSERNRELKFEEQLGLFADQVERCLRGR